MSLWVIDTFEGHYGSQIPSGFPWNSEKSSGRKKTMEMNTFAAQSRRGNIAKSGNLVAHPNKEIVRIRGGRPTFSRTLSQTGSP